MKVAVAVCCLVLMAACHAQEDHAYDPEPGSEYETIKKEKAAKEKEAKKEEEPSNFIYNGRYDGKCGVDGLYYRDELSFVICTGGNSYVQPCAPGSANVDPSFFSLRQPYNTNAFCSLNYATAGVYRGFPYRGFFGRPYFA